MTPFVRIAAPGRDHPSGARHVELEEIDSTNSYLLRREFEPGSSVRARIQHAGRGRSGKDWGSVADHSFIFSALIAGPISDAMGERLSLVPLAAGLAVRTAALQLTDLQPQAIQIKWPNDVCLYRNAVWGKVAGILVENEIRGKEFRAVIGIGLNWTRTPDPDTMQIGLLPAVALLEGSEVPALDGPQVFTGPLVEALNNELDRLTQAHGPEELTGEFNRHSFLRGRKIQTGGVQYEAGNVDMHGHLSISGPGLPGKLMDTPADLRVFD